MSPGFFAALGVPIKAGRDFTADDIDGGERVVIVSQSVADQLFAGRDVAQPPPALDRSAS